MMTIDKFQLKAALKRRTDLAEDLIVEKAEYLQGLTRLQTCLSQPDPSADGLPFLVVPYSESLVSLFSFTVVCRFDTFLCEDCMHKNSCMKKVLRKIELTVRKNNHRHIPIEEILRESENLRMPDYVRESIRLVNEIILEMGR